MPQLTVVVPLMDQVDAFENTLASILRCEDQRIQLVVTHDGRYDDPHGILSEVESVIIPSHRDTSLLGRVAAAASVCQSPWIHWLAPGVEATEGWCDELIDTLGKQSEVGLVSPRIFSQEAPEDCMASGVMATPSGHAQYLEDVYGEDWSLEDVQDDGALVGPTGWAGFCRRTLLEQWHAEWGSLRLPNGYAEQALGLMVQRDGWEHRVGESCLTACDTICEQIERGWKRDGRAASAIIRRLQSGSSSSKLIRSLQYAIGEIAFGLLSPGSFSAGVSRLSNLTLATASSDRRPAVSSDILSLPESESPDSRPQRRKRAA